MRVELQGDVVEYTSDRNAPFTPAHSRIRVHTDQPIRTGELESFLTARFRLYTLLQGRLGFADVEHEPWPLHAAQIIHLEQTLIEGSKLPQARGEPIVHYLPGVHVRISRPHLL
jgi:uncharacterized protein